MIVLLSTAWYQWVKTWIESFRIYAMLEKVLFMASTISGCDLSNGYFRGRSKVLVQAPVFYDYIWALDQNLRGYA